ncbi:ComEC/Rec2 family competence protein [Chloroflexota bacterium]
MTIVYLTLAWNMGIVLGTTNSTIPWWIPACMALVATVGAILLRRNRNHKILLLCLAIGSLGMLRMMAANAPPGPGDLLHYNGQGWREFEGVIIAEPDVRDTHVNLRVATDLTRYYEQEATIQGTALVQAPRYTPYHYGDRVLFSGTPLTPPEFDDFSYRDYLARQNIYTLVPNAAVEILAQDQGNQLYATLLDLKQVAQQRIAEALPEPQASLLTGILLGVETGISPEVRDAFNATGTSHVIAISGFNMTLIAGLVAGMLAVLMPTRRKLIVILGVTVILIYTIFVGANPAVLRATLMSILLISAPLFHRRTYVPASLAAAALLMSTLNPFVLWDVGFQLSFAAVLGLALFVTPLEKGFRRVLQPLFTTNTVEKGLRLLSEPLTVTLAAQIITLPLIMLYFGRFSLSSFAVNFLILPAQTPLLLLGGLATLIALVAPLLAQPFYLAAWLFLTWTVTVVRGFARLSWGELSIQADGRLVAAFFLIILIGAILQGIRPGWHKGAAMFIKSRRINLLLVGVGAAVAAVLWLAVLALPDQQLHVHFLDTGHSNGVLIETPDGAHILIDGGKYPTRLLTALGDHLPFWDRDIELLILTQPKDTQLAALPAVLERYNIKQILTNGQTSDTENYLALAENLTDRTIPALPVQSGYTITTNDGVSLEVLHPQAPPAPDSDPNDAGMVLRLTYGDASFLLTPDLSSAAEEALLASNQWLHGAVLQIPAHGATREAGAAFLAAVQPQLAVVQVDAGNRFGHPSEEILTQLGDTPLYRTDEHGAITISTDGKALWITTED